MNWTLEVVMVPVKDVDRAKAFYAERLGFVVDHDIAPPEGPRFVQLTPPGSGCSVVVSDGVEGMEPGAQRGVHLVVKDLAGARAELVARGVEVGEIQVAGPEGFRPHRDGEDLDNVGFMFIEDPDGNRLAVQQITSRP